MILCSSIESVLLKAANYPTSNCCGTSMIDTIGQRLKKARERRGLTLEKAAEATRIRQAYLRALETDDISALPSPVHGRGFLRNYAQYLNLDLDQMVDELRTAQPNQKAEVIFEREQATPAPVQEEIKPKVKAEEPSAETPVEPFWQTWLRRAKSEMGELAGQEESASHPEHSTVSPVEASSSVPTVRRT